MSTWNYRIIDFGDHLALHEVFYDETGKITAYTAEPVTFVADPEEGRDDISGALEMALRDAKTRSVLSLTDLPA